MGALDDAVSVPTVDEIAPAKDEMLLGLTIGREDGRVVSYPSGDLTGKLIPQERGWYKDAKAQGKTLYTDPYVDKITNKLCVSIAVPYYKKDGAFGGAVCEDISLESLDGYVEKLDYKGAGMGTILTADGKVVASKDTALQDKDAKDIPGLSDKFSEMVTKGSSMFTQDMNGEDTVIAYATIDGPGWIMMMAVPESVVYAELTHMKIAFVVVTLIGLIVIMVICQLFARRITEPIAILKDQAALLADGDLRAEVSVDSSDELGDLAHAFDTMAKNLRKLIENVSNTADQVAAASEELTASSQQSAQANQSVAQTIVDVANGMEAQLTSIDGVKDSVDAVDSQALETSARAEGVSGRLQETAEAAKHGQSLMESSVTKMEEIEQSVNATADVMDTLGKNSKEIGAIVETITGIPARAQRGHRGSACRRGRPRLLRRRRRSAQACRSVAAGGRRDRGAHPHDSAGYDRCRREDGRRTQPRAGRHGRHPQGRRRVPEHHGQDRADERRHEGYQRDDAEPRGRHEENRRRHLRGRQHQPRDVGAHADDQRGGRRAERLRRRNRLGLAVPREPRVEAPGSNEKIQSVIFLSKKSCHGQMWQDFFVFWRKEQRIEEFGCGSVMVMPEISCFMGIIIQMIFLDNEKHHKPHVHVKYGDYKASIAIDGELLAGEIPVFGMSG